MDLPGITDIITPTTRASLPPHDANDAFLAGGTWLFSEPQPRLRRLIDLAALGWEALTVTPDGLHIGATCSIANLAAFDAPAGWIAAPLIPQCCRALLGSFKIWQMATVGGNLCMALPAGPLTALAVALDGSCNIWTPDGGERNLSAANFVLGPQHNALASGEVLRRIELPMGALHRRTAFRQISLSPHGRSGVLLIGTAAADFTLTVTAATRRPVHLQFSNHPGATALQSRLAADIPDSLYYDDVHGSPAWRRHMCHIFAEEIRAELSP